MARFALLLIPALLLLAACSQPPEQQHLGIASYTPTATTDVELSTEPSVTFTHTVDPTTLSDTTVTVYAGGVALADVELDLRDEGITVALVLGMLQPETDYTIEIEPGVASRGGHRLAEAYAFDFTTESLEPLEGNDDRDDGVGGSGDGSDDGDDGSDDGDDGSDDGNDGSDDGDDGSDDGDDGSDDGDDGSDDGTGSDDDDASGGEDDGLHGEIADWLAAEPVISDDGKSITIRFSRPMDVGILEGPANNVRIGETRGTVTVTEQGDGVPTVAVLTVGKALEPGVDHVLTLTTNLEDVSGEKPSVDLEWRFTVGE